MTLQNTLDAAIENSRSLITDIATSQFGGDSPANRTITRRWTATDAAKLVGVSRQAITKAEQDGRLPPPDMIKNERGASRKEGYTIHQIHTMYDVFGTRPGRHPDSDQPLVISVCGHKGGSWKTSTSVYFAQWGAMEGFRVLLVDMDPQGTASLYHGYVYAHNTTDDDTALPWMLGQRGDMAYCLRETCWPGLDIIPAGLGLQRIETELERLWADNALEYEPHYMLRAGLETVYNDYDLVIIDGSPNLGETTVNMVCAADIILCPTPAELNDYMSTGAFFEGLRDLMSGIDLNGYEPDLRVLLTKVNHHPSSASQWMIEQIRTRWGALVLNHPIAITEEVGKGQIRMRTVYEQDGQQRSSSRAWHRAQEIWNPAFEEIITRAVHPRWPSKQEGIQ